MREPLSELASGLKNQDGDTYIFGLIVICVFAAMIARVDVAKATAAGCLFFGLYIVGRFILTFVRVIELKLDVRREVGTEADRIIAKHVTESDALALNRMASGAKRVTTRRPRGGGHAG